MAFCGQCGLLLTTSTTKCPRCGAATDFNAATPEIPEDDNSTTLMTHTDFSRSGSAIYTPPSPPSDAGEPTYYIASGGNSYLEQKPTQIGHPQSDIYPLSDAFQHGSPQSGNNSAASVPGSLAQGSNQASGMYPPGVFPATNPGSPLQAPTPRHKTRKWPFIFISVLIVALVAVTVMFLAPGSNPFAGIFGANTTPIPTALPTTTTKPSPTTATASTLQAQATIQQYYTDINNHDYQDAYNLWVSNPDNYTHYKQGFAHTSHDAITFGNAIPQIDGTIQINVTLQATEGTSGGGTKVSTYHGYYMVGQQADGSWKIIIGQLG